MKWKHERRGEMGRMRGSCLGRPFLLGLLACLILLGGCASVVPRELRKEIDRSISFKELKENPDAYVGRRVLLGGEIIEAKNWKDQTELEILQKPLGSGDVPVETDESEGRFLIHHPGYLDPAIYRSGRYVTIVGEVMGEKSLHIGEAEYRYPVMASKFLHLWPKARRYYSPYYYPYYYPPYYPYGGFWLYYQSYPLWPHWYYDYYRHSRRR